MSFLRFPFRTTALPGVLLITCVENARGVREIIRRFADFGKLIALECRKKSNRTEEIALRHFVALRNNHTLLYEQHDRSRQLHFSRLLRVTLYIYILNSRHVNSLTYQKRIKHRPICRSQYMRNVAALVGQKIS